MEITDYTTSPASLNMDNSPLEPFSPFSSKGLATIPDSFQFHQAAPKPNCIKRLILHITLLLVHLSTWTIQAISWILKHVFGYSSRQKSLYSQLYHISKTGDTKEVARFLKKHQKEGSAAGFLFGEFLHLPETHIHLPEILKGANVCFCQDNGFFFHRWQNHPDAYQRISSHKYQKNKCYAVGHFLFWLDPAGNTRFQFEKSPLLGFVSSINHLIDYLRYWRDNEQQGITGASPHTEYYCLNFPINPADFLIRKVQLALEQY